jgi:uncharacterized protein YjiS (DUF1127 family)
LENISLIHAFSAWLIYSIGSSFVHRAGIFAASQDKNTGHRRMAPDPQELTMFVSYILAKVQAYFRYRETVRELSLLSTRELDDLGISRFQIESIARQTAAA